MFRSSPTAQSLVPTMALLPLNIIIDATHQYCSVGVLDTNYTNSRLLRGVEPIKEDGASADEWPTSLPLASTASSDI